MHLDEEAVDAHGGRRPGKVRHVLALPAGRGAEPAGLLDAVRGVEDDRVAEGPKLRESAEVDDEVVVAEASSRARS